MDRATVDVAAAIRAAAPGAMAAAAMPSPGAKLGVSGLPARVANLSPGMIYGIACDQQAVRLPLVAASLAASLETGKTCVLVTADDPSMFLRKARLAGFALSAAARRGDLALFHLTAEAAKHMFRSGPERFLRELEHGFAARGAMVVLDQADALFMLSDPRASVEAADVYTRWASSQDHTIVSLFSPSALAPRDYLALRRVGENFAGFAIARACPAGATLETRHWFAVEGASPAEAFGLSLTPSGVFSVTPGPLPQDELPPAESVISVRDAMPACAPDWEEVATFGEAVEAAGRSAAATVILPFTRTTDFTALASAVAAIRALGRPTVRVAVRERELRLRAAQSLALMRLGVSAILPLDLPQTSVTRMVDLVRATRFSRRHATAVREVEDQVQGLLAGRVHSIAAFCQAVETVLAAADGLGFESCLVRLTEGADAGRLLAAVQAAGRDMATFGRGDRAWIFLFGISATAVQTVMARLLVRAPSAGWTWTFEHGVEPILVELRGIR